MLESSEPAPRGDKRVLKSVLGVLLVAGDSMADPVQAIAVRLSRTVNALRSPCAARSVNSSSARSYSVAAAGSSLGSIWSCTLGRGGTGVGGKRKTSQIGSAGKRYAAPAPLPLS